MDGWIVLFLSFPQLFCFSDRLDFSHELDDVDQNDTEGEAASESEGILSFITHFMTCTGSLC